MQQSPSSIVLSPEQAGTTSLLRQLFGNAVASRYVDFCKLVGGDLPLHATRTLAAHALRELDALLRQVLASPFDAVIRDDPSAKALRKKARKSLKEIGFDEEARQRADGALKPQLNFNGRSNASLPASVSVPKERLQESSCVQGRALIRRILLDRHPINRETDGCRCHVVR